VSIADSLYLTSNAMCLRVRPESSRVGTNCAVIAATIVAVVTAARRGPDLPQKFIGPGVDPILRPAQTFPPGAGRCHTQGLR
jgi:hypothetical protein